MEKDSEIIVLGAGVMGLSTTLSLLENGYKNVKLFDKRDYLKQKYSYFEGCDSPSSDMNKIFRSSYGSEVHYQEMAEKSLEKYLQWNEEIKKENWENGEPIYLNTGNVHLTDKTELPEFEKMTVKNMPQNSIVVSDTDAVQQAIAKNLDPRSVDPFEMRKRNKHLQGLLDTTGGMSLADKSCRWILEKCLRKGKKSLVTHFGKEGCFSELLLEYNKTTGGKKCVGIKTTDGKLHFSDHLIICSGPWNTEILPEAGEKLEATGGSVCLFKIEDKNVQAKYDQNKFPTWTYKVRDGAIGGLYGFPCTNGYLKIGYRGMKWINPKTGLNSKVKTKWSPGETETNIPLFALKQIKNFVRENIPEIKKISATRLCWYSDSEDNDYLISYCPYYEDNSVFIMGGDSGHCFMMLGSVGDVAVDIMNGKGDPLYEKLFSWERTREKLNMINAGQNDPRILSETVMATPKDWWIDEPAKL
jgi:sarcosine oxidase/L-pipecolate oxidase